jgi:hypothetical protein
MITEIRQETREAKRKSESGQEHRKREKRGRRNKIKEGRGRERYKIVWVEEMKVRKNAVRNGDSLHLRELEVSLLRS